jgi:hypothetical protein
MPKPVNPIQVNSLWEDAEGNIWKVIGKLPGGKVSLFDDNRKMFHDTYQEHIRKWIADGNFTFKSAS